MNDSRARCLFATLVAVLLAAALAGCQSLGRSNESDPLIATAEPEPGTPSLERSTPVPLGRLSLSIAPIPAPQGSQVRVSGRGFGPEETVVISASLNGTLGPAGQVELDKARASTSGTLDDVPLALPDLLTSGRHDLSAVGETSGRVSAGVLWIQARDAWINLPAEEMSRYEDIGLVAGGFGSNEPVIVSIEPRKDEDAKPTDATPQPSPSAIVPLPTPSLFPALTPPAGPIALVTIPTDTAGNSSWTQIKTPRVPAGEYSLILRGQTSGRQVKHDVSVKPFTPTAELSPWAGPVGTVLQVNVKGVAPGELVRVYLGEDPTEAGKAVADQWGNVWSGGPVRIPYGAASGTLVVTVIGTESLVPVRLDFKVLEPKPWLELTNWWGPPGSPVGFGGGGWAPGEAISIHVGDVSSPVVATARADDFGWLRAGSVANVPRDALMDVPFIAVGQESRTFASATFKLVYPFGIKPSP
jgi:hypothetical protein